MFKFIVILSTLFSSQINLDGPELEYYEEGNYSNIYSCRHQESEVPIISYIFGKFLVGMNLYENNEKRIFYPENTIDTIKDAWQRYIDIFEAPPLDDKWLFPCQDTCHKNICLISYSIKFLKDRAELFPYKQNEYYKIIEELENNKQKWIYLNFWIAPREFKVPNYYVIYNLKKYREMVGYKYYYTKRVPEILPIKYWKTIEDN